MAVFVLYVGGQGQCGQVHADACDPSCQDLITVRICVTRFVCRQMCGIKTVRILSFYNLQLQSTLVSLCNKYIYAEILFTLDRYQIAHH